MGRAGALSVLILFVGAATSSAAEDDLCARIRTFQSAPFAKDKDGKPLRRSIEFHWTGYWMDFDKGFGTQCHDGGTPMGKALCDWLPENTSVEFPENLPMNILRCYGWKIPMPSTDWSVDKASFKIETNERGEEVEDSDRYLLLEIDMRPRKPGHLAIRLSAIPWAEKYLSPPPHLSLSEPVDTKIEELYP